MNATLQLLSQVGSRVFLYIHSQIHGMSEIRNKTVLVTGGASGIGKLMGGLCLEEGARRLIIWDIDRKKTEETIHTFAEKGYEVLSYHIDVSNTDEIKMAANDIIEKWGGVDLLFNNAGVVVGKEFQHHTHHDIDYTMRINTSAIMHTTLALLPTMIRKKTGHIVNIASAAGMTANFKMAVYVASKWAVIGWSESLRLELEAITKDLHVTTVTPFYINTGMFDGVRSPLVPIVDQHVAARKIIKGVKQNKIYIRMPWIVFTLPFFKGILPQRWLDIVVGKWFGMYKSMQEFKGRK